MNEELEKRTCDRREHRGDLKCAWDAVKFFPFREDEGRYRHPEEWLCEKHAADREKRERTVSLYVDCGDDEALWKAITKMSTLARQSGSKLSIKIEWIG